MPAQTGFNADWPPNDGEVRTGACDPAINAPPPPAVLHRGASAAWRFAGPPFLVLVILIAFMPALDAGFVDWDDDDLLIHNIRYRTLSDGGLAWMLSTSFAGHFQPLTWLSYWLDWQVWNRESFGFHLTSVILHAGTALAFYFLARRLLTVGTKERRRSTGATGAALFAALLFAVHPLRVESVAWLAERRDVLSGLFYVLAVLVYIRYTESADEFPAKPSRFSRFAWYAGVVLCMVLSLLAKATAVTLPLVLLILDVFPLHRAGESRTKNLTSVQLKRCVIEKIPLLLIAVVAGWRAVVAQEAGGALFSSAEHDFPSRLAQASYGVVFYLWKSLIPTDLGPLYEIPSDEILFGPMLWLSLSGIGVIAVVAWKLRRRFPAVPVAFLAYLITVFPLLGLAQSGPQLVADRYSYLSCLSLALLGGTLLFRVLRHRWWGAAPNCRALLGLACVLIAALLTKATFAQSDVWLSPLRLWTHGVKISPDSPIANTNLADALARDERPEEAAHHYRRALELDPEDAVAWHHLGDLHARAGQSRLAIGHYVKSLRIDPNRLRACNSLGRLLIETGDARQGVEVLRDGARRHPGAYELTLYLARVLATHPDPMVRNGPEALRLIIQLQEEYGSNDLALLLTLASAYAEAGQFESAVETAGYGIDLADRVNNRRLAREFRQRMDDFSNGRSVPAGPP
jgi:tetratricopeptide (TPR) repeat protein